MRLWLSDLASKQLKGEMPPEEYFECAEHGKQAYVRTPEALVETLGKWTCGECVRQTAAKEREEKEAKKKAEAEARDAKKAAKRAAKDALTNSDEELAVALAECQAFNTEVRTTKQKLRDRRRRMKFARRKLEECQLALVEAQAALERARTELSGSEEAVPPLESALDEQQEQLVAFVTRLKKALDTADEAWKAIPPKQRKMRDRRARHQAVQLVEAHVPGAEDEDEDDVAEDEDAEDEDQTESE